MADNFVSYSAMPGKRAVATLAALAFATTATVAVADPSARADGTTAVADQPELQMDFPADQQELRRLPDGTEYFGANGTITNVGDQVQKVPPILIVLRDERERIVFSWEVHSSKPSLVPGESVEINEAVTGVPSSARVADPSRSD